MFFSAADSLLNVGDENTKQQQFALMKTLMSSLSRYKGKVCTLCLDLTALISVCV